MSNDTDHDFVRAPWTSEQVDALNRFQRRGDVHEFTCHADHGTASRALVATVNGWICPHCDYRQDWAHVAMLKMPERMIVLPCDVMLPPATLIRKGCDYSALMAGLTARKDRPPEECRFDDPAVKMRTLTRGDLAVKVTASEYDYEGRLAGIAVKASGAIRYIVEDAKRRLFIHNARQLGVEEGWLPDQS